MELHNLRRNNMATTKTINDKPLKQIMEELAADFPPEVIQRRDYDGVLYINVDAYRDRLNQVVGIDHYNERYTPVEIIQAKDSYAVKTLGTIELLDDDYNVILIKEASGGSNIAFPKVDALDEEEKPLKDDKGNNIQKAGRITYSLPNDFDSACQDAFKRICRNKFNMGKQQLKEAAMGTLYEIKLNNAMKETTKGHLFSDGTCVNDGKYYKIAIFKNRAEDFKEIYGLPKRGDTIMVYGDLGEDKSGNEQIIVKSAKPLGNQKDGNTEENNNTSVENSGENKKSNPEENKKTAEDPKSKPQPKPEDNLNIDSVILRVNTISEFKPLKDNSSYCVQATKKASKEDAREKISIIFLKDIISENATQWQNLYAAVNKKGTLINAEFRVQKGIYYFKKFIQAS